MLLLQMLNKGSNLASYYGFNGPVGLNILVEIYVVGPINTLYVVHITLFA